MANLSRSSRLHYSWALLTLTAATGAMDAVSYLALDRVFTGNMTGNILFLGFGLVGAYDSPILNNLVAVLAFMLGAVIAARLVRGKRADGDPLLSRMAFGVVTVNTVISVALGVAWVMFGNPQDTAKVFITGILALLLGAQAAAVKGMGLDISTVVVTMTMVRLASDSKLSGGTGAGWWQRTYAILCMGIGALISAWFVVHLGGGIGLLVSAAIMVAGVVWLALTRHRQLRELQAKADVA